MLALAGVPLGFRFRFLEPSPDCPAAAVGEVVVGDYDDPEYLAAFAEGLSAVTYEFENVPEGAVKVLGAVLPVHPHPRALGVAQDRLHEKEAFGRLGIRTPVFEAVDSLRELEAAAPRVGLPGVLKTRRFGYDGKGQRIVHEADQLAEAWAALGPSPLLLEEKISFRRELSIVSVRSREGETTHYPLVENLHRDGILRLTRAPASDVSPALQREAEEIATALLEDLEYVGVGAIELFETERGLLANELAPRVHNSGHWTQDGARTSQFENHIRAVAGLPIGDTGAKGHTAMLNLIGTMPERVDMLGLPGCHLHLYGKTPRPGRKLGHVNVVGDSVDEVNARLALLQRVVGG